MTGRDFDEIFPLFSITFLLGPEYRIYKAYSGENLLFSGDRK
jgi:hypothetical protein